MARTSITTSPGAGFTACASTFRLGRLRAARAAGDRGAISIELALTIIVMVAIAGAVLLAVKALATKAKNDIPTDLPVTGSGV